MNQAITKKLVTASCFGALAIIAAPAAAQECPTCCHASRSAYQCAIPDPVCEADGNNEEYACSVYSGLSFADRPGKIFEITWTGRQTNGDPPTNAFVFGFAEDGSIACQLEAGPFEVGVPSSASTDPGECDRAATWVFDANAG